MSDAQRDAWVTRQRVAVGSAWLRRDGDKVVAVSGQCPHLGCAVEFRTERDVFYCPCHDSEFAKTGEVQGQSPSRRGLDTLRVEIREGGDKGIPIVISAPDSPAGNAFISIAKQLRQLLP